MTRILVSLSARAEDPTKLIKKRESIKARIKSLTEEFNENIEGQKRLLRDINAKIKAARPAGDVPKDGWYAGKELCASAKDAAKAARKNQVSVRLVNNGAAKTILKYFKPAGGARYSSGLGWAADKLEPIYKKQFAGLTLTGGKYVARRGERKGRDRAI